tara:strand:+ start:2523 stop:3380 length:858 start_codon:yes stop_codon:yes gene_type:complete
MSSKVLGMGFPFHPDHSSCSLRKPKNFEWTSDKTEEVAFEVWFDNYIPMGIDHPKENKVKIGWICESNFIVPEVVSYVEEKMDYVLSAYDYIFTCDRRLRELSNRFIYCPPGSNLSWISEDKQKIYDKTKLCSIIASAKTATSGHWLRHKVAEQYKDKIDLYGGVLGSEKIGTGNLTTTWHDKQDGLHDYMFSFAIENASYETYFTEKIMDCFTTGTVPIYWGSPDIGDHFNKDGILILDDNFDIDILSNELYNSMLPAIEENFKIASNMKMADDVLYESVESLI